MDDEREECPQVPETEPAESGEIPAMRKNGVSRFLHALGFVFFIGGAVVGLATFWGTADYAGWLGAVIQMLSIWVYAAAYGGILLGLGEIIRLLDRE